MFCAQSTPGQGGKYPPPSSTVVNGYGIADRVRDRDDEIVWPTEPGQCFSHFVTLTRGCSIHPPEMAQFKSVSRHNCHD